MNTASFIQFFRNPNIKNILVVTLAIQMINICIDPADLELYGQPEDCSRNDIESVVEFFLEDLCSFENLIAERDEADVESVHHLQGIAWMITTRTFEFRHHIRVRKDVQLSLTSQDVPFKGFLNQISPPPRKIFIS